MNIDIPRLEQAGSIVAFGLVGYFSVRYYDTIMKFPTPLDILFLVVVVFFLLATTYYALGIKRK